MADHGTRYMYAHYKCRCEKCTAANRDYSREFRDRLKKKPWNEIPHGTAGGYRNYSCRCDDCRKAASAEWREQWRRARQPPPEEYIRLIQYGNR